MADDVTEPGAARFPAQSVAADGEDLGLPTAELLRSVGMLPKKGEVAGPTAAVLGTPDSVWVIESGATALSKWWAAGAGATILAGWATVGTWWGTQDPSIKETVIWGAAICTAAIFVGIAYIVGSDVRGRAAATAATLEARGLVAQAMVRESARLYKPAPPTTRPQLVSISPEKTVRWRTRDASDENSWKSSMTRVTDNEVEYHLTKGTVGEWVPIADIDFGSET